MTKLKYFVLMSLAVGMLAGCKKQLDLKPTDQFTDESAFRTLADAQMGTNEAYARYSAYGSIMYGTALLTDEAKLGADNAGQGTLTYRYQYSSDGTSGGDVNAIYSNYYYMIDQVNRVLAALPNVFTKPEEEPRRTIVKGQLLALRAIAHFDLLQAYAKRYDPSAIGIPLLTTFDKTALPKRNTIGEVVTQIESDLSTAKTLLPPVTTSSFSDTTMNQVNVTAYQARVALYKGDYQNAVNYATTVITSNVKPLVSGSAYTGIWTDANNNETLFRVRMSTSTLVGGYWTTTGGLIYIAPSDKLVASFGAGDVRKAAFIGTTAAGNNYVNKFYTSSKGARVLDIKACRIAEMYLIRAEAYAKLASPNLTAGAADLNTLRAARITGYAAQSFASSSDLVNAVMDERFKELCFEGFRFFDLKRNGLPVQRNLTDANAAWQTLDANSFRFLLPIPQYELLANPNNTQNPGY